MQVGVTVRDLIEDGTVSMSKVRMDVAFGEEIGEKRCEIVVNTQQLSDSVTRS